MITSVGSFYLVLTQIIDSFSCSTINTNFFLLKKHPDVPDVPEKAEMRQNVVLGCSLFILPTCWYRVCEIEFFS